MGWTTGLEPATTGTTIQGSTKLSYVHHKTMLNFIRRKALSQAKRVGPRGPTPNSRARQDSNLQPTD